MFNYTAMQLYKDIMGMCAGRPMLSHYGVSWFITPRPAVLWLGRSGRAYPDSIELAPVETMYQDSYAMEPEARQVMEYFNLNEHYYTIDLETKWMDL